MAHRPAGREGESVEQSAGRHAGRMAGKRTVIRGIPAVKLRPARALAAALALALPAAAQVQTVPGMPPVTDAANLYGDIAKMRPDLAGDRELVYVPHVQSNDVYVIDPK